MKLWEGLGYYSRARNLHATAQFISSELGGVFPTTYDGLLQLKGVGPYTAAAIASICFDEPAPVLDGNVYRFISRFFGITDDIGATGSRKKFMEVLHGLIPDRRPGDFNQAIMEFGATVCKPSPACQACPFSQECYAFENKMQDKLPVKLKRVKVRELFFHYLIIESEGKYLMRQRNETIWKGLYEFPLEESSHIGFPEDRIYATNGMKYVKKSDTFRHLLTHRTIWLTFYHYQAEAATHRKLMNQFDLSPFSYEEMLTLPKPKSIVNYLQRGGF